MAFELIGKLHKKLDAAAVQVTERFKKREFVVELEDGAYPQYIKLQLTQERCDLIDAFKEGDLMKVSFNLKGRPYNDRQGGTTYFTNLEAWRIEKGGSTAPATPTPPAADDAFPTVSDMPTGFNDDLPF